MSERRPRRHAWLDLLLVGVVLLAAWARTPVGAVVEHAVAVVAGWEHRGDPLTSYFRIDRVQERLVDHLQSPAPVPDGPYPDPWRSAVRIVWDDPAALDRLDAAYDGDPEAALATVALGAEQRDRAIRRARAAGLDHPERYETWRAYLPASALQTGDERIGGVLAVSTLLDVHWPVATTWPISSGWGHRQHPMGGGRRFHNGVDLAVPIGTPVHAAQAGEVAVAAEDGRNGRYLVLDHGHGVRTAYCHLDAVHLAVGDRFDRGAHIADSGNTGRSTGPHLHFVVRVHGKTIDPLPLRR